MEVYEFPSMPIGNDTEAGLLRTVGTDDEKNCQCSDAAITPFNFYNLANYRMADKAYAIGDIVAVPYHAELQLKCTTAGTTSANSLDTSNVTAGSIITDGGVTWTVTKRNSIEGGGTGGTTIEEARQNLGLGLVLIPANSDLNDYITGGRYSCWLTTNAQSLVNNPMSNLSTGIILEVIVGNGAVLQIVYGTLVRGMYIRRKSNSDGSWNDWKNINNGIKTGYAANSGYILFENKQVIAWKMATITESNTVVTKPISFTTNATATGDRGDSESAVTYPPMRRYDLTTDTTDTFIAKGGPSNTFHIIWFGYKGD